MIRALHWVPTLISLLALFVLYRGAGNKRTAQEPSEGTIEFAPGRVRFWAWVVLILCLAQMAIHSFQHHHRMSGAFLTSYGLVLLFSFPEKIVLDNGGIRQTRWFLKDKCVPWGEIVEIKTGKKDRAVRITGANGTNIIHSAQLPDRTRLLLELKRHCGENLPPDFPREPLSS